MHINYFCNAKNLAKENNNKNNLLQNEKTTN